ncbi:metallopeptidase [Synechococcus sp. A15-127]|uniref:Ig-like domain-containing protein n=1 Tax=Synechococcus sp. A15-127 TaxID=1050624 RepID=UPI0016453357|nr:Ig-like domain-containing protein [Synechococcus sp. A15-127]QNI93987.1 metallopeptidase [Synechococcus sp. A15-127]
MTSATSDDLSGRAYYYYSSRPYGSSQTSDSESETTASEDAESSDEADDDTIKIYVNSGSFRAPYFSFFTDSSRSVSFGTNELDVSKTYEFIGANSTHPFYIGDSGYRQGSSTALVLDGDGSASDGIGRDQSFTLSFAADIDLSLIDNIDYFCTAHSSMIGSFQLVGEPLGRQDANDEEAEIVVPTISISTDDTSLTSGETARITFILSEGSTDFTADDLTVSGGVVSDLEAISATEYTAVFTPEVESTDNGTVTVAAGSFSNSAGTTNNSSASLSMRVDTRDQVSPALEISADDEELTVGETATIRFTLSEASSDFTAEDVEVSGGELSGFSGSGTDYSASFTPAENSTDEGVITVVRGAFRDAAGNINGERTSISLEVNTVPPDTTAPALEISADDEELTVGETATIRFTLSEASSDFTAEDVEVSGGELSGFSGSGTDYSASFTPAENSTDEGVITVLRGAFRDAAGNINAERTSISLEVNTVPPDTTAPVLEIIADDEELTVGETATIRFTLSEASSDFTAEDVEVSGGELSGFSGSGADYSASFTPAENSMDEGVITVLRGAFRDAAGNINAERTSISLKVNTVPPDTTAPALEISADDEELTVGETATIRFTLSEASSDFTAEDVEVSGGELSGFSGSGTDYSASFTPAENSTDEGVITVVRGAFRDAAGNINGERTSISLEVNTVPPVSVSTPQSELPVELFVSAGSFAEPYYTFYTDAEGNEPLVDSALDVDSTYLFRRLDDVSSHPFYVSNQGHNQTSSSALILQGDGSAERGIKGTDSFQISFSEDIDLDVVGTVDYYCSSHPSMISSFRLFRGSDENLESASDAETDDADAPLGFAFASQDVSASSEAEADSESTADVALTTVDVLTGDVNNNGSHDVSDAISVLRNIVGLETDLSEFPGVDPVTLMDIDGSGSVDVGDAVGILRAIVGLESLTSLVQVSLQASADLSNALLLDPQGLQGDPLAPDPLALLL